jgi:DNA gyrase inhibitor GyrI
MVRIRTDATLIQWEYTLRTSLNPATRALQYRLFSGISNKGTVILESFRKFIEKKENIYGMNVVQSSTIDTILISTKEIFPAIPTTEQIYTLIGSLKDYIDQQHANQTGSPMLNITQVDSQNFQAMVAVPTDKILSNNGRINFKRMVAGNFLVAEIKGGTYTVAHALNQLRIYTEDYKRTTMAIPFEVMVTDRIREKDSLKWMTKIYMPVY